MMTAQSVSICSCTFIILHESIKHHLPHPALIMHRLPLEHDYSIIDTQASESLHLYLSLVFAATMSLSSSPLTITSDCTPPRTDRTIHSFQSLLLSTATFTAAPADTMFAVSRAEDSSLMVSTALLSIEWRLRSSLVAWPVSHREPVIVSLCTYCI